MIIKIDKLFTHRYALSLIHVINIIYMYKQLTSILRMQYSKAENNKIYAAMLGRKLIHIATVVADLVQ